VKRENLIPEVPEDLSKIPEYPQEFLRDFEIQIPEVPGNDDLCTRPC